MNRALIGVTVVGLALAVAACASTQTASRTPAQYVEDRQKLMKDHGDAWKNVQDSAKAGNMQAVASNADRMATNAKQIPALFPEGSMTEKSKAKPEIWQKKAEFDAGAKKMEMESLKLRDTARTGDAQATNDIIKDFGRTTCGSCHTPFRVPPPRQG
jgi:cytochrome c556